MSAKILVPIDLSPISDSVVEWAASLARDIQGSLIILHVQEPVAENMGGEMYFPMPVHENPEMRRALESIVPRDKNVVYEHRLVMGSAADTIVWVAKEEQVSLIVMGSHGRSGLARLLMGSVAESVLRHASCPLLVYKEPAKKSTSGGTEEHAPPGKT